MRYMLDTNIVSYLLRDMSKPREMAQSRLTQWGISSVVAAELSVLLFKTKNSRLEALLEQFLSEVEVANFGSDAAMEYGRLVSRAQAAGRPIGGFDALVAAHALSLGAVLVTHNTKHFEGIDELVIEDWAT